MTPGVESDIRRVESLADSQKRIKRRAEFVDAIFQLSSTGDYTRALYQCINALAEFPNDGGLLTIKTNLEEKAEHATELQKFVSDGLTFLRAHEVDAALECFGKARRFDQSNLQVRYLIGIALLEKARLVMHDDRRKLSVLLDEARSFIPNEPELQTFSFESDEMPDENWEKSLVRIEHPATELMHHTTHTAQPAIVEPVSEIPPRESPRASQTDSASEARPIQTRENGALQKVALVGLVILGTLVIGWLLFTDRSTAEKPSESPSVVPSAQTVDISATPTGAEIFIDDRKVGESSAQAELARGNHTVMVSLAGYESRTLPLDLGSEPKALQVDLQPLLMDVHLTTDQSGSVVWMDDQPRGDITDNGITISEIEPGVHFIKIQTPDAEIELSFEFHPGKTPTPVSLPPRQVANVLFAGSADGKTRVHCNCVPAGLRVGDVAELMRTAGLELPLEGQHAAELWIGKSRRKLTIHGGRQPVATIDVFSSPGTVRSPVER
jgi:hypothetical protein